MTMNTAAHAEVPARDSRKLKSVAEADLYTGYVFKFRPRTKLSATDLLRCLASWAQAKACQSRKDSTGDGEIAYQAD